MKYVDQLKVLADNSEWSGRVRQALLGVCAEILFGDGTDERWNEAARQVVKDADKHCYAWRFLLISHPNAEKMLEDDDALKAGILGMFDNVNVRKEVVVEKPVIVERRVEVPVDRPVFVEKKVEVEVERPVFVDKIVEVEKIIVQEVPAEPWYKKLGGKK